MSLTLLADIGGSKSRFALANSAGRPERILVIENDTVVDLDAAVSRYLDETGAHPRAATLAIAGPIGGDEVALTNRAWRFRRGEFAKRFGFSHLRIVNDFEAIAWALRNLAPTETRPLGKPVPPREGVKVVLGPGTGLGVAALIPLDGRWHVVASEGGHASFGPQALDEVAVFSRLWAERGAVSAEAVLSGPGLVRLARALDPQGLATPRKPSSRVRWHASPRRRRRRVCSCGCWGALPAGLRSRSRRWAASILPAGWPAGSARFWMSRNFAPPSRDIPRTRRGSRRSRPC
jgi:glucokinase